ncbi:lysylphosphatidylglycerol synthase transmembrane domain-containing protein [Pedobacter sp. SYP-B3415]|uniref:lysylphosphatidylglycerol synthase transmembrane domain-containing protein n=1 Tax=Pedobacter sp. SYP-B3415 TaxID=2496641 RepID=UPI00101C83FB|nr:lysylphosphatidylglycerol synthase transmembrane domain-containing protein [Pedobacter sp. SYP-B3415]
MRDKALATGKYFLLFLLGLALLYLAFRGQNMSALWKEIAQANLLWVLVSAACVVVANVLRAWRWNLLFLPLQFRVSLKNSFAAVMVGYLANLALPRVGEITRCTALNRSDRVPLYASLGTVVTERLFDVLVLFLTICGMLVFQYPVVGSFMERLLQQLMDRLHAGAATILLIFGGLLFAGIAFVWWYLRSKKSRTVLRIIVGLKQGLLSFNRMKQKAMFLLLSALIWLCYYLSVYLALFALPATAHLGFDAAYTALVFSGLAMIAPVQGGIGVFHWMVGKALACYLLPFPEGLAYATIIHSSQMILILVIGSLSLVYNLIAVPVGGRSPGRAQVR